MRRPAALLWLGITIIAMPPLAAERGQQPAAAFRTGVDLLTLEATVLDRDGVPARDLQPGDFTVTVGGRPRKVVFADFHGDRLVSVTDAVAAERARRAGATGGDGRIVVFVIDRDSLAAGNEAALL